MYVYLSQAHNQALANASSARLNAKVLRFYSGVVPLNADAALVGGNVKLGECLIANPAAGAADANGRYVFGTISPDLTCDADGVCTFARIEDSGTGAVEMQFDVGTSGTTIILNTTAFTLGGTVTISSGALQHHNGV